MSVQRLVERDHLRIELDRMEAYSIRNAVSVDGMLGLRKPDGSIDATSVAIEISLRDGVGLPHWIRELDAPPEFRNPAPWAYCATVGCAACDLAVKYGLPPASTAAPRWFSALAAWIVSRIDDLTARIATRRAGRRP